MKRGQSRVKGRAALVSAAVLCALLALGGVRGGLHAGAAAVQHPAQAVQHLLGNSGSGGLAEGGGPPAH